MKENMLKNFNQMIEGIQFIITDEYGKFLIMFALILFAMLVDILTGLRYANIDSVVNSSKLASGLLKKGQIIMVILLLFFIGICLPSFVGGTMILVVFLYELYNELVSITENLYKQGIEINFLKPILNKLKNEIDKGDNTNE